MLFWNGYPEPSLVPIDDLGSIQSREGQTDQSEEQNKVALPIPRR